MPTNIRTDTAVLEALINGGVQDAADRFLREVANDMKNEIVLSFGESPSPPGGPPGVDTGALRASMTVTKERDLEYTIHDQVNYGFELEELKNRPFMRPVFEHWRSRFAREAQRRGIL